MVTYSLYDWDGASYNASLLALLFPFVDAHIAQFGEGNASCAPDVFRVFTFFFEGQDFKELKKPQKQPLVREILIALGATIEAKFPDLLQVLVQKHVFTLDFLRSDIATWFLGIFQTGEIQRLWISLLSRAPIKDIFVSFLVAFLMFALREIGDFAPLCSEEFVSMFNGVKRVLPLQAILATAARISDLIRH
jgi:hypothetical protein